MARILIMDDDDDFREMLKEMLEMAGYEVAEAANGKEGMKVYRAEPADLIVIDIFMPEQEGIETIRELKRDFPDTKIIAISGGGRGSVFNYLNMVMDFGVAYAFTKPFERDDLLKAIHDLLPEGAKF
jgi:CheY-like chemotaxis protein